MQPEWRKESLMQISRRLPHLGKRVGFVSLGVLLLCQVVIAEAGSGLRILSWNVRNYNLADRYAHGYYRKDYPKPEEEKAALRKVIIREHPDVMLFQEVGGDEYLEELRNDLKIESGIDYPYLTTLFGEDAERKLGILSRVPFEEVVNPVTEVEYFDYFGEKRQVKRGLLEVTVKVGGEEIHLMTYHLKSRYTSDDRDPESRVRREREARTIRDYLRELMSTQTDIRILMMGDLNDGVGSQAFDRITQISGNKLMIEVGVTDENSESWTYCYARRRSYEQIDFLFVSPYLADVSNAGLQAKIVGGPDVMVASDHRPIVVDLCHALP